MYRIQDDVAAFLHPRRFAARAADIHTARRPGGAAGDLSRPRPGCYGTDGLGIRHQHGSDGAAPHSESASATKQHTLDARRPPLRRIRGHGAAEAVARRYSHRARFSGAGFSSGAARPVAFGVTQFVPPPPRARPCIARPQLASRPGRVAAAPATDDHGTASSRRALSGWGVGGGCGRPRL